MGGLWPLAPQTGPRELSGAAHAGAAALATALMRPRFTALPFWLVPRARANHSGIPCGGNAGECLARFVRAAGWISGFDSFGALLHSRSDKYIFLSLF